MVARWGITSKTTILLPQCINTANIFPAVLGVCPASRLCHTGVFRDRHYISSEANTDTICKWTAIVCTLKKIQSTPNPSHVRNNLKFHRQHETLRMDQDLRACMYRTTVHTSAHMSLQINEKIFLKLPFPDEMYYPLKYQKKIPFFATKNNNLNPLLHATTRQYILNLENQSQTHRAERIAKQGNMRRYLPRYSTIWIMDKLSRSYPTHASYLD